MNRYALFVLLSLSLVILLGCSGGGIPTGPGGDDSEFLDPRFSDVNSEHFIMGFYDIWIDPFEMTAEAFPSRIAHPHYDVTDYVSPPNCMDCIQTQVISINPDTHVATIDVTLKNPTTVAGFDVRGILLLTSAGHDLIAPDGWVSIFDDGEPPYFNPFMRYAKTDPDGKFPGGASLKQTYKILLPTPPKYSQIKYIVEAWRPKNGKREAYSIENELVDGYLFADGSNMVTFSCRVMDRNDDVENVTITCDALFTGSINLAKDGDIWSGKFSNDKHAAAKPDAYKLIIEAQDPVSDYILQDQHSVFVIEQQLGWKAFIGLQDISTCSIDITGANVGPQQFGVYLVDSQVDCSGMVALDGMFTIPLANVSLKNMSFGNPSLQPYPPVRFDSAGNGAICFTNNGTGSFVDGTYVVPQNQLVVALDDDLYFHDDGFGDHQAHHPYYADSLVPVDVCNGFQPRFYMLWVSSTGEDQPLLRACQKPYTKKEQVIGTYFPPELVGDGAGMIANDASKIKAIDVREIETSPPFENIELFVLESTDSGVEIEIFHIYTNKTTGISEITYVNTLSFSSDVGTVKDIELLPVNGNYDPNPTNPSLAVLINKDYSEMIAGYIEIYDVVSYDMVESIGTIDEPGVFEDCQYLDVHDLSFTILVTAAGTLVQGVTTIFSFTYG